MLVCFFFSFFFQTQKEMLGACMCGPWVVELTGVPEHVIGAT